jgi:hypothetical protein
MLNTDRISKINTLQDENTFAVHYRNLCDKLAQKGGRITESEERRLQQFKNLDKEEYLKRENLFE